MCLLGCMPSTRQETRLFSENATALETAASAVVITTALETAANAVIITDTKGIILWVNPAFTSLTGYPSEEVIGKTPRLLKSGKHDRQFYQNLWTAILTGKTWRGGFTNRRKDGTFYQDEHTITPVRSKEGVITHFIAIMNDVTERKRAEEALRQSEERLAGIIGSATDGIITVDQEQRIILLNVAAENMFGYTSSEILGQPLDRLIPSRFCAVRTRHIREFAQSHVTRRTMGALDTLYGVRANGEEFAIEASISHGIANGAQIFTAIVRDVNERKRNTELRLENMRLEERGRQMEEANRIKSEFLANMSHELRTPLNGIIGFAEFLADGKPGGVNPKQKEYLGDILNSGKHLLELINDILDLTKVSAGKMELDPERFSIRKAIEEVCAVAQPIAQKKAVHINVSVAPEIGEVTLDQKRFKQVLNNLLSNAIKFNHNGGEVEVLAEPHDTDRVKLVVKDTGFGVKAEDLGRLFNEFEQLDSGVTRRHEGTGLGLALTRKIVELQGGEVNVESEVGKGSSFTVVLPLVLAESSV